MEQLGEMQDTDYFLNRGQIKGCVSKGLDGTEITYSSKKKCTDLVRIWSDISLKACLFFLEFHVQLRHKRLLML